MAKADRPRRAWDRRTGESHQAYATFRAYLELGPSRTLPQLATITGRHYDTVKRWSAKHDWRLRAAAHDDHMNMLYWENAEAQAAEMGRRHQDVGQRALEVIRRELDHYYALQELRTRMAATLPDDPRDDDQAQATLRRWCERRMMNGRDMAQLIKAAGDLEHRAVIAENSLGDALDAELEGMTPDEMLEQLSEMTGVAPDELREAGL